MRICWITLLVLVNSSIQLLFVNTNFSLQLARFPPAPPSFFLFSRWWSLQVGLSSDGRCASRLLLVVIVKVKATTRIPISPMLLVVCCDPASVYCIVGWYGKYHDLWFWGSSEGVLVISASFTRPSGYMYICQAGIMTSRRQVILPGQALT